MKLKALIVGGEGKKVEFKEILPASDKIMKTAVAFSNGAGGKLIIGIKDDGQVIGISDEDVFELPEKISNIVYDGCYPTIIPEIYTEAIGDKVVLVVEFYHGNLKPYYLKSKKKLAGTYVRVGATNKQADEEMIRNIERQKRNICFDEEICYEVDMSQLDIRKIKQDFCQLTGIRRIVKECDDKGLVFPTIKETGNFFKIILYKKLNTDADKMPISADKMPISADKILSENEKLIVGYLEQHLSITNKIAREQIGLKETATKNLLKKMCEKQVIVAVGKGKGRHYILYSK